MKASVKEKLHEYIDHADTKKLQAIYTLVQEDIEDRGDLYDEKTIDSFRATSKGYASGKIKGYPVEESMERIRKELNKKRSR
jgi:hypothetical protein